MGTRERPAHRGRRRTNGAFRRLGEDHRQARVSAGLSLREAARASGAAYTQLWRFEHGDLDRVSITDVGAWCAVVGLDVAIRAYPAGDAIRDRAQLALLERFRARLHPSLRWRTRLHPTLRWRTEVPLPIEGDLRAWDAEIRSNRPARWRARVEAETRIADGQALERRLAVKARDDPDGHVILPLSDTRANRAALRQLRDGIRAILPLDTRHILTSIRDGRDPGGSGIIIL